MKKKIKLMLAIFFSLMLFTACEGKDDKGEDTPSESGLERVTLRFIFHGEKNSATDEVWKAISDYTRDTLNVDFDIQFISGSDFTDRLMVMAASGESWDMNFDAEWLSFFKMKNQGAYLELNELLPEYAPNLYARYQETGILDAATIGGDIVALPWTMTMNFRDMFLWRGDLADAAGIETSNIKDWESMDAFLQEMKKAYPDRLIHEPVVTLGTQEGILALPYGLGVRLDDPELKVFPMEETESFRTAAYYAEKWQSEGIIWKDVLTDGLDPNMLIDQGRLITAFGNHEKATANRAWIEEDARWDYALIYPEGLYANRSPLANLMAIPVTAENPERTLMFLELLETDQTLYDMVHFGIEGETFEFDGEAVVFPEGMNASNSNYMEWGGRWALWKPEFMRPDATYDEGFWEKEAEFVLSMEENVTSPLEGFNFDPSQVSTEVALRTQIFDDAWRLLSAGLSSGGYEKAIENLKSDSEGAGLDLILEEFQRQVDEFIASEK